MNGSIVQCVVYIGRVEVVSVVIVPWLPACVGSVWGIRVWGCVALDGHCVCYLERPNPFE